MKRQISILIIVMFLSIPFYISTVFAGVNTISGDGGTDFKINKSMEKSILSNKSLSGCADEIEDTEVWIDILEKDEMKIIEGVSVISSSICNIMGSVHYILDAVGIVIGFLEGACCPMSAIAGAGTGPCANNDFLSNWMDVWWHGVLGDYCRFIDEGFCAPSKFTEGLSLGDYTGLNEYGVNQYEVFPAALLCLNIPATIYHLRKYVTLQKIYKCCLTQACGNGLSQEPCEQWLDEAECMYIKGGFVNGIYQWISGLIVSMITIDKIENTAAGLYLNCIKAPLDLYAVQAQWQSISQQMEYLETFFDDPDCSDLSFGKMNEGSMEGEILDLGSPLFAGNKKNEDKKNQITYAVIGLISENFIESWDGGIWSSDSKRGQGMDTIYGEDLRQLAEQMLDMIIGDTIEEKIRDSCKEEWNTSSISPPPPVITPNMRSEACVNKMNTVSGSCSAISCKGPMYNSYDCSISYTVLNCKSTNITAKLKFTGTVPNTNVGTQQVDFFVPLGLIISGNTSTGTINRDIGYDITSNSFSCSIQENS